MLNKLLKSVLDQDTAPVVCDMEDNDDFWDYEEWKTIIIVTTKIRKR